MTTPSPHPQASRGCFKNFKGLDMKKTLNMWKKFSALTTPKPPPQVSRGGFKNIKGLEMKKTLNMRKKNSALTTPKPPAQASRGGLNNFKVHNAITTNILLLTFQNRSCFLK